MDKITKFEKQQNKFDWDKFNKLAKEFGCYRFEFLQKIIKTTGLSYAQLDDILEKNQKLKKFIR